MSKIRNSFIALLESDDVNQDFASRLKAVFGNSMTPGDNYANGEAVMTYNDAISHLENIIKHISTYDDNDYVDKNFWIKTAQEHINFLKDQQAALGKSKDDPIDSFGEFFSNFIRKAGDPQFLDQYTKEYLSKPKATKEDVEDFNTISDTYRMQDMPQ